LPFEDLVPVSELANTNAKLVVDRLKAWNSGAISDVVEFRGSTTIVVPHRYVRAVAKQCKEDPELNFNLLSDVTCVDRFPVEPRFELNYQLLSIPRSARISLRTAISGQNPVVDSMMPVWQGANWLEREVFDLFGIRFDGHTDLRRILLPDDFQGAPLRRDYPTEGPR
jgi:NADH-quinone oxidoreductase subunit C